MAKMHKLIQNEYIKTWKKVSTKVLFILIALSVLALMGLGKIVQSEMEDSFNYIYNGGLDYNYEINQAEKMKYDGYEIDIEMYNFIMDNEFLPGSWQVSATHDAFSYEVGDKKKIEYNYSQEDRMKLLQYIKSGDWKKYCEFMLQNSKRQGLPEAYVWEYQYRISKNIPLPANAREMFEYPNDVIESVATAKINLVDSSTSEMEDSNYTKEWEDTITLGMYRLENDIKLNVAENKSLIESMTANFWVVFNQSASLLTVIGVLIIIIAGSTISNEFSHGTIKFLLINPVKRWKILVSKYAMCVSMGFLMIICLYVLSLLFSMLFFGTEYLGCTYLEVVNGVVESENGFVYVFKNYMFRSVQVLVMATLAFAISSLAKNSAMSIGISLFAMLSGNSIVSIFKKELNQDWVRYLVFANTDFSAVINGTSGFANHSLTFAIGVVAIHMLVFFLIAWDGFTKREI